MTSREDRSFFHVLGRMAAAASAVVYVLAYIALSETASPDRHGGHTALVISCVLSILGHLMLVARWKRTWPNVLRTASQFPVRCVLLAFNLFLCVWLTVNVFTVLGIIGLLLAWGLFLLAVSLTAEERVAQILKNLVRLSPVSFICIYLLLGLGEVFLHSNPMLVGGGGGGNPALRSLYRGLYKFNSLGRRGHEFSLAPGENVFRIVMLGDSLTFGQGVPEGSTYSAQVERQLKQRNSPRSIEVINAGASGTNTAWQFNHLQNTCLAYQPDLVTVQFYLNDLERSTRMDADGAIKGDFVDDVLMLPAKRSYALFFLQYRFERLRDYLATSSKETEPLLRQFDDIARDIEDESEGWLRFESAVEDFALLSKREGLPTVMILFPHPGRTYDSMRFIHKAVAQRVRAAGLPVIDLIDVFSDLPPDQRTVSSIDHHPSPIVYECAASRIVKELDALQLIPEQPGLDDVRPTIRDERPVAGSQSTSDPPETELAPRR